MGYHWDIIDYQWISTSIHGYPWTNIDITWRVGGGVVESGTLAMDDSSNQNGLLRLGNWAPEAGPAKLGEPTDSHLGTLGDRSSLPGL